VKTNPKKLLLALLIALALVPDAVAAQGGNGQGNANGHDKSDNSNAGNGNNGNGNGGGNGGGNGNSANGRNQDVISSDEIIVVPDDQRVVQNAVRAKAALPLEAITSLVAAETDGRILDVQLVSVKGIYLYDVTVLEKDGVLHKLYYNARSGVRIRAD
jgi:uncharacterized membrane protein YkoI